MTELNVKLMITFVAYGDSLASFKPVMGSWSLTSKVELFKFECKKFTASIELGAFIFAVLNLRLFVDDVLNRQDHIHKFQSKLLSTHVRTRL